MRPEAIEAAMLNAFDGGLTEDDCKKLDADEAAEVARRLIEESKRLHGAKP